MVGMPFGPEGSNRPDPLRSAAITSAILRPNSVEEPAGVETSACAGSAGTTILRLLSMSPVTSTDNWARAGVAPRRSPAASEARPRQRRDRIILPRAPAKAGAQSRPPKWAPAFAGARFTLSQTLQLLLVPSSHRPHVRSEKRRLG